MHPLQKEWRLLHPERCTPETTCRWHKGHAFSSGSCRSVGSSAETSRYAFAVVPRASRCARETGGATSDEGEIVEVGGGRAFSIDFVTKRLPPMGRMSVTHSADGVSCRKNEDESFGALWSGGWRPEASASALPLSSPQPSSRKFNMSIEWLLPLNDELSA